jgi:hypothetical protein
VFDEKRVWRWAEHVDGEDSGEVAPSSTFIIEHRVTQEAEEVQEQDRAGAAEEAEEPATPNGAEKPGTPVGQGSPAPATPVGQGSPAANASASSTSTNRFTSPPPDVSDIVDDDYDDEPLRFRVVDNIIGHGTPPERAECILDDQVLHLGCAEEPMTFREAERDHRWRKAMTEEMNSIVENKTWAIVDPPTNCSPNRAQVGVQGEAG